MNNTNIISFSDFLEKKNKKSSLNKNLIDILSDDIKDKPELIEWFNFQNLFHKHKLFLQAMYTENHQSNTPNPNSGYFIAFDNEQIKYHINKIIEANNWLGRKQIVIDATDCSFCQLVCQISNEKPKNNSHAFHILESLLLESDNAFIISNLSKSKLTPNKSSWARSFIKINDDAHFNGITPKSDILFVDSASFLERSWQDIGSYLEIFA